MHYQGSGVDKDYGLGVSFFQKGCDAKDASACINLSIAHATGHYTTPDTATPNMPRSLELADSACTLGLGSACITAALTRIAGTLTKFAYDACLGSPSGQLIGEHLAERSRSSRRRLAAGPPSPRGNRTPAGEPSRDATRPPGYDALVAKPKRLEKRARVAVRSDGSLRLAVVADTHSAPHAACMKHLGALSPDAILHAGDIGDLAVLDELEAIAPLFAIRGNIDVRAAGLPDLLTLDVVAGDASVLRILLKHIAVDGPRLRSDSARLARSREVSLVVCGHSHVPLVAREGDLSVFNPGSVGPRRFHLPILFGTIDVTPTAVHLAHFDCETGRRWEPKRDFATHDLAAGRAG